MENQEKELDLLDLIKKTIEWGVKLFHWLKKKVIQFIRFNWKYVYLILAFVLLASTWVIYNMVDENRALIGDSMLQIQSYGKMPVAEIVQDLGQKLDPKNDNRPLVQILSIDEETAKRIASITPYYYVDADRDGVYDYIDKEGLYNAKDTNSVRMYHILDVEIVAKKPIDFNLVQKRIVEYLNDYPLLQGEGVKRIETLNSKIDALDKEIAFLDSVRKVEINKEKNTSRIVFGRAEDEDREKKSYKDMLDLLDYRNSQVNKLYLYPDIVSSPVGVLITPRYQVLEFAVKWIGLAYLLALLLAFCINYRKSIVKLLKEEE